MHFIRRFGVRVVIGAVLAALAYATISIWMPYQREQRIAKEIKSQGADVRFAYAGPDWMRQSVKDRLPYFDRICDVRFPDRVVSAKLLSELGSLTRLEVLDLEGTHVTNAGLEHLKGLTSLKSLCVIDTKVTDAGLEHLKGLTNLEVLSLIGTQVTDAGLEHLKGLTSLEVLGLDSIQVTDVGLEHLRGLTNLGLLYLEDTQVTDAGLEYYKGLTGLKVLYLKNTQVTAEGRAMLRKALPNCEITPDP